MCFLKHSPISNKIIYTYVHAYIYTHMHILHVYGVYIKQSAIWLISLQNNINLFLQF